MHSFAELTGLFEEHFKGAHFPRHTPTLYEPADYILGIGGKRIRPVCVLLGNQLFDEIDPDAYHAATAIELFHNFSLIHDDIMDQAPLRRGKETVHIKYGSSTALLAGDVMLVRAYDYLNKIKMSHLHKVLHLFNNTASAVCEGQQLDMDFEKRDDVKMEEYVHMITLKTSVLLAASLKLGALLGGAGEGNQQHLYEFGKNLGIAFQIQDDYLDAFGNPEKFGKKTGGDIIANKKTFLLIHALQTLKEKDLNDMKALIAGNVTDKVEKTIKLFQSCNAAEWAMALKTEYLQRALTHLEDTAVLSVRKKPLEDLAKYLMMRDS